MEGKVEKRSGEKREEIKSNNIHCPEQTPWCIGIEKLIMAGVVKEF
jgi:hypothetical protein